MEEKNKGIMDRIKKVLGAAVMAATISGISTDAIANEVDLSEANKQFATEFYENKPKLQFADYRAFEPGSVMMNYTDLKAASIRTNCFDESIEKKYYDILSKRKSVMDSMFEYEKDQLSKMNVSKDLLENYSNMSPEQILEKLKLKNLNLISKDFVSLDTPNDRLRIDGMNDRLETLDFSSMSVQDMAMLASRFDIEIENNKKIMGTKNQILENDSKYIQLKVAHEQIKSIIKSKKGSKFSPITAEQIKLMYEQSIIETQIMLRDAEIESEVSQLVYGKAKEQEKDNLKGANGSEISGQPNKVTADVGINLAEESIENNSGKFIKTSNSFRDELNSRNPDSLYYVENLDDKEKEIIQNKSVEGKKIQETENSLDR